MKYAWMAEHRGAFDAASMCRVLGVTRAGYYAWRARPAGDRARRREAVVGRIRARVSPTAARPTAARG